MFNLLWQIYYAFVHNFSVVSGQILKKLSSHLVTLLLLHPFDEIEKTYFLTFQVFRNRRENFRATFLTFCRKRIRRRIDVVCRKGRNYSLKPVWPDWAIFESFVNKFYLKSSPNISCLCQLFWQILALLKLKLLKPLLGNIWFFGYFYSNIWSHWTFITLGGR